MKKPQTKKTSPPLRDGAPITVRLTEDELCTVRADINDMVSHGAPPCSANAYMKHGGLSYPRLRRIEAGLRAAMLDPGSTDQLRREARRILEAS